MCAARALVWFKRDLRSIDHAPLAESVHFDAALALCIIEPDWLAAPDTAPQHVAWALQCLASLRDTLAARGLPLLVRVGPATQVLGELRAQWRFTHLLSHEETGPLWSYRRDLAVADWCRAHGVSWREWPQTGVVRRLRSRDGWASRWTERMNAPPAPAARTLAWPAAHLSAALADAAQAPLPTLRELGLPEPTQTLPAAGERAAWQTLESFLTARGGQYRRALSSPLTAERGCSRLSAHLAFGAISMRSVHQATEARIASTDSASLAHQLRGFASRLRWHCHFMQKLEDEPRIEHEAFVPICDGLRPGDQGVPMTEADHARLQAWCEGRTGFPMVDACMRQLSATGWLNFRMRAMLVSVAAYHLWLHWRLPGLHLARLFLDYEAGIHWSQMQMQSGTTGINTLRMYSPTKQAREHDPQGVYIRRWVPELQGVPLEHLAQPWRMDAATQAASGCRIGHDYPAPVVDEAAALRAAKERLYGLRASPEASTQADAVQRRHGSRNSGLTPAQRGVKAPRRARSASASPTHALQGDLFADAGGHPGGATPSPG